MIFGKSHKHPLPTFPSQIIPTFYSLCEEISEEGVKELRQLVTDALAELEERAKTQTFVDVDMAKAVSEACLFLLDLYPQRSAYDKSLIVGAARYFAISDDPFPDTTFATGLDDDARIANFVLEQLGIEDRFIVIG